MILRKEARAGLGGTSTRREKNQNRTPQHRAEKSKASEGQKVLSSQCVKGDAPLLSSPAETLDC